MARAYIVNTDGTSKVVEFEVGNSYDLIRNAVHGLIECVSISPELDIWLNEEGKLTAMELNEFATALYRKTYNTPDFIVGDVIFTGGADEEGETLGLSDEMLAKLITRKI
jgi:hypothetical protein